jgi:hypothetical protein
MYVGTTQYGDKFSLDLMAGEYRAVIREVAPGLQNNFHLIPRSVKINTTHLTS